MLLPVSPPAVPRLPTVRNRVQARREFQALKT